MAHLTGDAGFLQSSQFCFTHLDRATIMLGSHGLTRRRFLTAAAMPVIMLGMPDLRALRSPPTIYARLSEDPDFSAWLDIVDRSGLRPELDGVEQITVFALRNDALADLAARMATFGAGSPASAPRATLTRFVLAHMLAGAHRLPEFLRADGAYPTLAGGEMTFDNIEGANLTVAWGGPLARSSSTLIEAPIEAANGVIYPISYLVLD